MLLPVPPVTELVFVLLPTDVVLAGRMAPPTELGDPDSEILSDDAPEFEFELELGLVLLPEAPEVVAGVMEINGDIIVVDVEEPVDEALVTTK